MRLKDTEKVKKAQLVDLGEGVFLSLHSVSDITSFFNEMLVDLDSEDTVKQLGAIDAIFENLIVQEDGTRFDDIIDAKATEVLDIKSITAIIEAIPRALNPNPK